MEIEGDTVIFKSYREQFLKERKGLKPNTVRKIDESEVFDWTKFMVEWKTGTPKKVKIVCEFNLMFTDSFTRTITDITFYDGVEIISWNSNEIGGDL